MHDVLGPGTILLGKYRVESVLGQGGMGVVLRVTHLHLGEELAVKVLLPEGAISPDVTARFLREAQSVVRLRGEHVARVSDVGVLPEGLPFMVMEYLRGVDLCGELARRGTLPPGEAVDYVLQACEALAEAHARGIVHRDIKPANLFLTTRPDGSPLVKVLDFGISKAPINANNMVTKTQVVMGTPGYMSPEQMKATRDVDARTDIWALGIVLYECLGGRRPFDGDSYAAIVWMAGAEPPPPLNPRIPRALQAAVLRCLEKDRRGRFPSVAALAAALAPFARNQREAATIVERTSHMLERPSGGIEPVAVSGQAPAPTTTLSGSAGFAGPRLRRRNALIGGTLVLGSAVLLSIVVVMIVGRSHGSREQASIEPESYEAKPAADEHTTTSTVPADANGPVVAATPAPKAVEPPPPANSADSETTQKVARCAELLAEKRWQALLACASEVDAHGDKDSARRFRAVATLETASEVTDRKVRHALSAKNLKEAQRLLKQMAQGSVYYKPLSDLFDQVDASKVEEAKRIVQIYLDGRDCVGLKRYLSQDTSTSGTERVVAVFNRAVATCTEGTLPGPVGTPSPESNSNSVKPPATPTQPDPNSSKDSVEDGNNSGSAQPPATPTQPDPVDSKKPVGNEDSSGSAQSSAPSMQPGRPNCGKVDVDDLMAQARNQFHAGYATSALSLMKKALECKQSVLMYRLAAMYACRARDVNAARGFFSKIPEQFQAAIEQECQIEGLNIRES